MPLAGLVVNRAGQRPLGGVTPEEASSAAAKLVKSLGREDPGMTDSTQGPLAAGLLRLYADRSRQVAREAVLRSRFAAAHPQVPTAVVPALAGDVHDLDGLRRVGVLLGGQDEDTRQETG
jgi:hypothetical protein